MKRITKDSAFLAFMSVIDDAEGGSGRLNASDVVTVIRFIEQQWEPEEHAETVQMNGEKTFEVTAKSEGTI